MPTDEDELALESTDAFLKSKLTYTTDDYGQEICLLRTDGGVEVGVMMGWEREISEFISCICCTSGGLIKRISGGDREKNVFRPSAENRWSEDLKRRIRSGNRGYLLLCTGVIK